MKLLEVHKELKTFEIGIVEEDANRLLNALIRASALDNCPCELKKELNGFIFDLQRIVK